MIVSLREDSLCFTPQMLIEKLSEKVGPKDKVFAMWVDDLDAGAFSYMCSNANTSDLNLMLDVIKQLLLQGQMNA